VERENIAIARYWPFEKYFDVTNVTHRDFRI
jgi:hypothetical protein